MAVPVLPMVMMPVMVMPAGFDVSGSRAGEDESETDGEREGL